jgi:hypothetical protein
MVAGVGFILKNFTLVLAPRYSSDLLLLPVFLSGLAVTGWFLTRGIDVSKWEAKAAA